MQELYNYGNAIVEEVETALENGNFWEYLDENALDIRYVANAKRELLDCQILVTFGGPNVWIDTEKNGVAVYWGSKQNVAPFHGDTKWEILDYMEEYWRC